MEQSRSHLSAVTPQCCQPSPPPPHSHPQPVFAFLSSAVSLDFGKQSRSEQERRKFWVSDPLLAVQPGELGNQLKKEKKLSFFSSLPSNELAPSPPHHHRRKTIESISIPMKRGSHTGCDSRPALGRCQGPRRDELQLLHSPSSVVRWRGQSPDSQQATLLETGRSARTP